MVCSVPSSQRGGEVVEPLVSEQWFVLRLLRLLQTKTYTNMRCLSVCRAVLMVCSVPRSQRGGEVVEPLVSEQWFVRMAPLAEPALAAVADGSITIMPERFEKIYNMWLENIKVRRLADLLLFLLLCV
jgi:valyl-tRNA synthetase